MQSCIEVIRVAQEALTNIPQASTSINTDQ